MRAGKIRVELELDDGRFVQRVVRAGTTIKEMERTVRGSIVSMERLDKKTHSFGRTLRDVTVTVGLARAALENLHAVTTGLVYSVIRANAEIERMNYLFRGMSDATDTAAAIEEANAQVEYLFDLAKKAPFSINALGDAMVKIKAGGIDPMAGGLNALTNAVAAFGGNDVLLGRAAIAIQQMAGKGVISMEELRQQLGEAVPQAMNLMARATGMSMKDMVDVISQGGLESKTALERMFYEMELVYAGSAERMMQTWNGMVARLRTSWMEFMHTIGDAGGGDGGLTFFQTAKYHLGELIALLDSPAGQRFATSVGESLKELTDMISDGVKWVYRYREEILTLAQAFAALWVAGRVLGIMKNIKGGIVDVIGGFKELRRQIDTTTRRTRASVTVMGRMAGQQGFMAVRRNALRASVAVRALGTAVRTLAGPIGFLLTTAIALWIERLINFKSAIEKAEDAWANLRAGIADEADMEKVREDVERTTGYIEGLEGVLKRLKNGANVRAKDIFPDGAMLSTLAKEDQALLQSLQNYNSRYTKMMNPEQHAAMIAAVEAALLRAKKRGQEMRLEQEKLFNDQMEQEAERLASLRLDTLNRELETTKRIYREQAAQLQSYLTAGKITQEQYYADLAVIRESYLQTNMDLVSQERDALLARLSGLKEGTKEYASAQQQLAKLAEIWENLDRLMQSVVPKSTPADLLVGKNKDDEKKLDRFNNHLVSLRARLADVTAETKGASGELAKLESKLASGAFGDVSQIDPTKLQEAKRIASELDAAMEKLKAKKEVDKVFESMADRVRQAAVAAGDAKAAFDGDWTSTGLRNLDRQLAKLRRRVEEFGDPNLVRQFDVAAEEVRKRVANAEVYEAAKTWKEKTRQIRASLAESLADRRRHAQMALELEIARIRDVVAQFKGGEDEKKRLAATAEAYIRALRDQTARENEGAFKRTMRSWVNATENMEEATSGWLDSAIDKFVEFAETGKFKMGELTRAILADILKIQMRAMIAKAVLGSSAGGGGGIFDSLVSGIAKGLGAAFGTGGSTVAQSGMTQAGSATTTEIIPGALYHTGGIVGRELRQMRLTTADLFKSAKKFHTGGFPGLRTDEVPTILKKGEGVFTEQQMKALGGLGSPEITVNVINQTGQRVNAEQQGPRFDGERMILDVILKHASRPGQFREGLKGALAR